MSTIKQLTANVLKFRNDRDWARHHKPKDEAISLCLEALEVLEHFQWKNGAELNTYIKKNKEEIGDELADVLFWVLLISHDLHIDIVKAHYRKLKKTAKKYPVEKAMGSKKKWNEL